MDPTQIMPCPKRQPPERNVDPEKLAAFAADADVLPLYERSTMEYIFRKHYSLNSNEYLKCAWTNFKNSYVSRIIAPHQLPGESDLHFHNGYVRLMASETIHKHTNHRKSLKPGPGVDYGGQMPIPQELFLKRSAPQKDKEKKKAPSKNKKPSVKEA